MTPAERRAWWDGLLCGLLLLIVVLLAVVLALAILAAGVVA